MCTKRLIFWGVKRQQQNIQLQTFGNALFDTLPRVQKFAATSINQSASSVTAELTPHTYTHREETPVFCLFALRLHGHADCLVLRLRKHTILHETKCAAGKICNRTKCAARFMKQP